MSPSLLIRPLWLLALALPALASAQTSTLDKIKQSGSMTLAYRESSIPFSYLDDKAQPTGFGYEICEKIADRVKAATGRADLKKQYQAVTSANRIPLLVNGTIDIECGSTTNNSERGKQVAFAINYFYTGTRFLVKTGTKVDKLADLAGKTVVSTTGTTNFQIIRRLNEEQKLGIDLLGAKDHAESALMVQNGRAVAFGMDEVRPVGHDYARMTRQHVGSAKAVGWPMQRSKGGEGWRSRASGDMSGIDHPTSLARTAAE